MGEICCRGKWVCMVVREDGGGSNLQVWMGLVSCIVLEYETLSLSKDGIPYNNVSYLGRHKYTYVYLDISAIFHIC